MLTWYMVIWVRPSTILMVKNGGSQGGQLLVRTPSCCDLAELTFKGRQLKNVGQPTVALAASLAQDLSSTAQDAATLTREIKKLGRVYPEIVPGIPLLPALARTSEVICEVTSRHDSTVSELLAFGTAANQDNPRTGATTVPIVATAGGKAGEAVRLALLGRTQTGWHGNKTVSLNTLSVVDQEQTVWSGHGGPIQQLNFAEVAGSPTTWLAVRYPGATMILHPVLRRSRTSSDFPDQSNCWGLYPTSRLDPNPIATLLIERSGGAPHADVSFNPWYEKQFATVDHYGLWSVWDIENQDRRKDIWTVKTGSAGYIHDAQGESLGLSSNMADGWGSVLWACNVYTLLVFSRKSFILCNLRDASERVMGPDLAQAKNGDWILGVKRSPSDESLVFVVTSSRIFWLRIVGFGENKEKGLPNFGATILLSWRHFRDQGDTSLFLNILNDTRYASRTSDTDSVNSESETGTMIILYSRLTGLATVYNFEISPSGHPYSASDPYVLTLGDVMDTSGRLVILDHPNQAKSISTIVLRDVEYKVHSGTIPSGLGHQYMKRNVRFYRLSALFNDLSLEHSLYASIPVDRSTPIQPPGFELPAEPRSVVKVVKDTFVVSHGISHEEAHTESNLLYDREHTMAKEDTSDHDDQWTVNLEWLERYIRKSASSSLAHGRIASPIANSSKDVVGIIKLVIENAPASDEPGIKLL